MSPKDRVFLRLVLSFAAFIAACGYLVFAILDARGLL
jgi:hypothetical protein